jgi:hypothetical protein
MSLVGSPSDLAATVGRGNRASCPSYGAAISYQTYLELIED